jgi:hypothetical protein
MPRSYRGNRKSAQGSVGVRGTCPVCRLPNLRLRMMDGKLASHGRTAASPRGCAGTGEPPLRRNSDGDEVEQTGATIIGFRADTVPGELPTVKVTGDPDDVDVPVARRDEPDLGLRIKPPPPLPPTA